MCFLSGRNTVDPADSNGAANADFKASGILKGIFRRHSHRFSVTTVTWFLIIFINSTVGSHSVRAVVITSSFAAFTFQASVALSPNPNSVTQCQYPNILSHGGDVADDFMSRNLREILVPGDKPIDQVKISMTDTAVSDFYFYVIIPQWSWGVAPFF